MTYFFAGSTGTPNWPERLMLDRSEALDDIDWAFSPVGAAQRSLRDKGFVVCRIEHEPTRRRNFCRDSRQSHDDAAFCEDRGEGTSRCMAAYYENKTEDRRYIAGVRIEEDS